MSCKKADEGKMSPAYMGLAVCLVLLLSLWRRATSRQAF
jgi:hypothetical protein